MAGTVFSPVLMVFSAILAISYVSALPKDFFPTTDGNSIENSESVVYPLSANHQHLKMPEPEEKSKSCFHFFVSRNMSSLLADATKMLRTIRDRQEREWILTFIYRIKSLAEHLRSHPESQNYDCLPTDDETKKRIFSDGVKVQQQPELYFVDDVPKRSSEDEVQPEKEENFKDNQDLIHSPEEQSASNIPLHETESKMVEKASVASSTPQTESPTKISAAAKENGRSVSSEEQKDISLSDKENADVSGQSQEKIETGGKRRLPVRDARGDYNSIILSSEPDCESQRECRRKALASAQDSMETYYADAGVIYPMFPVENSELGEMYQQEVLKKRIRKALLEELAPELKKFRTVGGTPEDLMTLWESSNPQEDKRMKENNADFDYEETGAAAGDLNMNERIQPERTVAPSLIQVKNSRVYSNRKETYEPYDDSDVLVQQLFEVRHNESPSQTTKSLNYRSNENLITSTENP